MVGADLDQRRHFGPAAVEDQLAARRKRAANGNGIVNGEESAPAEAASAVGPNANRVID